MKRNVSGVQNAVSVKRPEATVEQEMKQAEKLGWVFSNWFFTCHPRRCSNPHGNTYNKNNKEGAK